MAAEIGTTAAALEKELLANGDQYSYFQAIRLLHLCAKRGSTHANTLRIRPKLSLAFPESDIDRIEQRADGGYRITANFFGLYGVASPLPVFYTEDLFEEEREGRHATRDFLDVVHYTMYPLLFGAWSKYRLQQRVIENEDQQVLNHLYAFTGLGDPDLRVDLLPGSASLLRYAGILNQRPRSALGLRTMLADAFKPAAVEIDTCVPQELAIPADQRLRLGADNHCLGENAYLGNWIDDHANQIRIRVQDISAELFQQLLPGAAAHQQLQFMTRYYLLDPLTVTAQLQLRAGEAEAARLGGSHWSRLGLDTWLNPAPAQTQTSAAFSL